MLRILILNTFIFLCFFYTQGQTNSYQALLDSAIKFPGHFLNTEPVKKVRLAREHVDDYYWTMKEDFKNSIDTAIILDIINNNQSIDTTKWTDTEIKNYLLVSNANLTLQYIVTKLNITDKALIRSYNELLKTVNNPSVCNKNIFRLSRPLFDRSGRYAILQYENLDCEGEGKIGLKLFINTNGTWKESGDISSWLIMGTHDAAPVDN